VDARISRDGWARLLVAFARSKLTARQFCAQRHINERTFRWWSWKLGASSRVATGSPDVHMLPVTLAEARLDPIAVGASVVIVELPGIAVRVPVGVDTKFAADLIAELRARC
jgi:hypothetical protein